MIHWRQGRFLTAGSAKSREPGSGGLSLQTANGSNSSQIGGGVLGSSCDYDRNKNGKLTAWRP